MPLQDVHKLQPLIDADSDVSIYVLNQLPTARILLQSEVTLLGAYGKLQDPTYFQYAAYANKSKALGMLFQIAESEADGKGRPLDPRAILYPRFSNTKCDLLTAAVWGGAIDSLNTIIAYLRGKGQSLDSVTAEGFSPLWEAVDCGNWTAVQKLLASGLTSSPYDALTTSINGNFCPLIHGLLKYPDALKKFNDCFRGRKIRRDKKVGILEDILANTRWSRTLDRDDGSDTALWEVLPADQGRLTEDLRRFAKVDQYHDDSVRLSDPQAIPSRRAAKRRRSSSGSDTVAVEKVEPVARQEEEEDEEEEEGHEAAPGQQADEPTGSPLQADAMSPPASAPREVPCALAHCHNPGDDRTKCEKCGKVFCNDHIVDHDCPDS
jgi:hypothetical protein